MATKTYTGSGGVEAGRSVTKIRAEQIHSEDSKTSLAVDLQALRGQISDIIGGAEGYETDVAGYNVQLVDLAAHVSAHKDATRMDVLKDMFVTGSVSIKDDVAERLYIVGASGEIKDEEKLVFDGSELAITGDIAAVNAAFSADLSAVNATLSADLSAVNATLSADLSAVNATLSADLSAVNATLSGDLSANDGTFSGNISAVGGTFSGNISAVDATLTGDLSADDGAFAGNVTISGNLTISGTTTSVDTVNLEVEDNMIILNKNETGAAGVTAGTAGIEIERGALDNAIVQWLESADKFELKVGAAYADLKIDDLEAVAGTFSGNISAVDATLSGDLSAVTGSFSGPIDATHGTFSGDLDVAGLASIDGAATLGSTLSVAGASTLTGLVDAKAGVWVTGSLKIEGDTAQRLYIVGSAGEIKDEELLTFDGSELRVAAAFEATGAAVLGSTLEVTGEADFLGALDVAGQSYFANTINLDQTANQSILKTGGYLLMSGSADLRFAAGAAVKFVDVNRAASTWTSAQGVQLSTSSASWTAYKSAFAGAELSLLDAIATVATGAGGGKGKWKKSVGTAGTTVTFVGADQVGGSASAPSFPADAGRTDIYLNGQLMAAEDVSVAGAVATFTFSVQIDDVVVAVIR